MKEIGGYFELDCAGREFLHKDGVLLNSGRNALRYIVRAYGIRKIFVPYFTCPCVCAALRQEGCVLEFYEVGIDLLPKQSFPKNAYVLCNNYFGACGKNVKTLAADYPNLIVDNAQALYSSPCGLASFYSPRKFFGLPDGGIAVCKRDIELPLERDSSLERMTHLLKRIDSGSASAAYSDFRADEESLASAPVLRMSRLTEALLGNLDTDFAKHRRLGNVAMLHREFHSRYIDKMSEEDVPLVYPLYSEDARELRTKLIANKIYVAAYWPGMDGNPELQQNILAIPIDHRYDANDMQRIVDLMKE